MARNDATPWQPGSVVLTNDDIRGKNPYTRRRLTEQSIYNLLGAIALTCYQSDENISLIRRQSNLME